jgi:hemerythrin-like metal-binding protein
MDKLVWGDDNLVHLPEFDSQHKLLFSLLNELINLEQLPPQLQKQLHLQTLRNLVDAIRQHFDAEERFMRRNAYPDELQQLHKTQHFALVDDLKEFIHKYSRYSKPLTDEMVAYLYKWLVQHMRDYDRKLGDYFAGKSTVTT